MAGDHVIGSGAKAAADVNRQAAENGLRLHPALIRREQNAAIGVLFEDSRRGGGFDESNRARLLDGHGLDLSAEFYRHHLRESARGEHFPEGASRLGLVVVVDARSFASHFPAMRQRPGLRVKERLGGHLCGVYDRLLGEHRGDAFDGVRLAAGGLALHDSGQWAAQQSARTDEIERQPQILFAGDARSFDVGADAVDQVRRGEELLGVGEHFGRGALDSAAGSFREIVVRLGSLGRVILF